MLSSGAGVYTRLAHLLPCPYKKRSHQAGKGQFQAENFSFGPIGSAMLSMTRSATGLPM
jgi:hypothetical protein